MNTKNELLAIIQSEIDEARPLADKMAKMEGWEDADDMRSNTDSNEDYEMGWLSALEYINQKMRG